MTYEDFINRGRIRQKLKVYQRRKEKAINLCREVLLKYQKPYVSISGGKDSIAMLFIVNEAAQQCNKSFDVWAHVSDASFPGTIETCQKAVEMTGRKLTLSKSKKSAFDALSKPEGTPFGKTGVFFDAVREYSKNKDLAFVGVRMKESNRRRVAGKVHGQVFTSKQMGDITVCHPLLYYELDDVAAILLQYNAPIHPIYQKISVDPTKNSQGEDHFIRLSYITSRDLLSMGQALFIKTNYPEEYQKLVEAYPDIKRHV